MVIRPVQFPVRMLAAVLLLGAIPSCPALAQYNDNPPDDAPDYQPRYEQRQYQPRCHYVYVRVYDEAYGDYVTRRKRVCDEDD